MRAQLQLDDADVEQIALRVVALLREELREQGTGPDGWLDTRAAATYAGCSVNSLRKAMAGREVRFSQSAEGGKAWFKRSDIDAWRTA